MLFAGISAAAPVVGWHLVGDAIDQGIRAGNETRLHRDVILYIAVNAVAWALGTTTWVMLAGIGQRMVFELRRDLFEHLTSLSLRYFSEQKAGWIIARLTSDVDALSDVLNQGLTTLIVNSLTLVAAIAGLFLLDWRLGLVALLVLPPGILVTQAGGIDPILSMPTSLTGSPGETLTVPITIDNATGVEALRLQLQYNTTLLDTSLTKVRLGTVTTTNPLDPQDQTHRMEADLGQPPLETPPSGGTGAGLPLILLDPQNAFAGPPPTERALPQALLQGRRFPVFQNLRTGRLPHVPHRPPLPMRRFDLLDGRSRCRSGRPVRPDRGGKFRRDQGRPPLGRSVLPGVEPASGSDG